MIKDIIEGHWKELTNLNESLLDLRMKICKSCKLYLTNFGGLCNPSLYLNPDTDEVSETYKPGFKKGCGCRLRAKTRLEYSACPLGKW